MDMIDIPGEYLHTYVDKHGEQIIIMLFKGKLAELMVMVYPKLYIFPLHISVCYTHGLTCDQMSTLSSMVRKKEGNHMFLTLLYPM